MGENIFIIHVNKGKRHIDHIFPKASLNGSKQTDRRYLMTEKQYSMKKKDK